MHETELSRNYQVEVEILTPLHIGNGVVLKRDFDFVVQQGRTFRLNDSAILNEFWPTDEREQALVALTHPSSLLGNRPLSPDSPYVQYAYAGAPILGEIREQIKDVYGHAYVPGSSLKGAVRTALMRTMIEGVAKRPLQRSDIGGAMRNPYDARAAKEADDVLDRRFGGRDPNHDLFRGLSISDTAAAPKQALSLQPVQIVPGLVVDVEALRVGQRLQASLRIDRYVLNRVAPQLGFEPNFANTVQQVARAVQFTAETRMRQELKYHVKHDHAQAAHFYYTQLQQSSQTLSKNQCLLQLGFASGWRAKTLLGGLDDNAPLLAEVIADFHLAKGHRQAGQPFPKARHLALLGRQAALPMGWVKLTLS